MRYSVKNGQFYTKNTENPTCCARPIYCANTATEILTGELPVIRFCHRVHLLGTLKMEAFDGQKYIPLHEFENIEFFYKANISTWILSDKRIDTVITLTVGAPEDTRGFVLSAVSTKKVIIKYLFGESYDYPVEPGTGDDGWNLNTTHYPELKKATPDICYNKNTISKENDFALMNKKSDFPLYIVPFPDNYKIENDLIGECEIRNYG